MSSITKQGKVLQSLSDYSKLTSYVVGFGRVVHLKSNSQKNPFVIRMEQDHR